MPSPDHDLDHPERCWCRPIRGGAAGAAWLHQPPWSEVWRAMARGVVLQVQSSRMRRRMR